MSKQHPTGHGHTKKHVPPKKHAKGKTKHDPKGGPAANDTMHHGPVKAPPKTTHTKAKHPKHTKARKLAIGDAVACCATEALAASLRLAGRAVTDDEVLELYWRTAVDEDAGASILATLQAAAEHGLAGVRPVRFAPVSIRESVIERPGLILGLELPGSHAVAVDGPAWWSWGRRWDPSSFPAAVIEEAWAVVWS